MKNLNYIKITLKLDWIYITIKLKLHYILDIPAVFFSVDWYFLP